MTDQSLEIMNYEEHKDWQPVTFGCNDGAVRYNLKSNIMSRNSVTLQI